MCGASTVLQNAVKYNYVYSAQPNEAAEKLRSLIYWQTVMRGQTVDSKASCTCFFTRNAICT